MPVKKRRRFICRMILLLVFALASATAVSAAGAVPAAVMNSAESVVRITAKYNNGYASGSGFVILSTGERTLIATNNHVVEQNPLSVSVYVGRDQTVSADIIARTEQKDMAVLELAYPVSLSALEISPVDAVRGDVVYAVGFPGIADKLSDTMPQTSEEATVTDGIVSAVRQLTMESFAAPAVMLQTTAAVNPGNSGGPLLNVQGQVVGINTLAMAGDSQGVFGAVAASELLAFLADNRIDLNAGNSRGINAARIAAAGAVLAALAATAVLIIRKRRRKNSKTEIPATVSLRDCLRSHPAGLGIGEAVHLLMPVLLQVREMHNNGSMHLQLSPDSIRVNGDGAIADAPVPGESARYTTGFAAPEIYKNTGITPASDVYSLCAVLLCAALGITPENALVRTPETEPFPPESAADENFRNILRRGLALAPEDRTGTVQELITQLTSYNTASSARVEMPAPAEEKEPLRRKRRWGLMAAAAVPLLLIGAYLGVWRMAESAADRGDFTQASRYLFIPMPDSRLKPYVEAGLLLEKRDFSAANEAFGKLAGYKNADSCAWESLYRYAAQKADANDFEAASAQYRILADNGYKDSEQKLMDTEFREGVWLLNTKNAYADALEVFESLDAQGYEKAAEMIAETNYRWAVELYLEGTRLIEGYQKMQTVQGYADADDVLAYMRQGLYEVGQAYYADGSKQTAKQYFEQLPGYRRSDDYLFLISQSSSLNRSKRNFNKLLSLMGFEDANLLLLVDQEYAEYYLAGKWKKSNGSTVLTMEENGSVTDDLPTVLNGSCYYFIQDGYLKTYQGDSRINAKNDKYITVVDRNTIEVYCYKDGKTYKLYRK